MLAAAAALPRASVAEKQRAKTSSSLSAPVIGFYQKYISDLRRGHCRFDPSCSHYCSDAIAAHGFFTGAALTADRLIRCNAGAFHYHAKGPDGRLIDPAVGPPAVRQRPQVPRWLLPEAVIPPFPVRALQAQPLDLHWMPRRSATDLLEYAAFADALAVEGDSWRAETEYKRVAFLAQAKAVDRWALMKTGICYYRWKQWDQSAPPFEGAAEISSSDADRNVAHFMAAAAYFNKGEYRKSTEALENCADLEGSAGDLAGDVRDIDERVGLLGGLCSMASGDWETGASHFARVATTYPDSPNRNQALYFKWKAEEGAANVSHKNPDLAAGFSIIPGMGQMYSGRYFDGFRHLVFDGLLMVSVYRLFRSENYAAVYLLAGFTLPFYAGNIVGAKESARSYNATRRAEYVADVIEGAAAQ